jgi:hypothetical protein
MTLALSSFQSKSLRLLFGINYLPAKLFLDLLQAKRDTDPTTAIPHFISEFVAYIASQKIRREVDINAFQRNAEILANVLCHDSKSVQSEVNVLYSQALNDLRFNPHPNIWLIGSLF